MADYTHRKRRERENGVKNKGEVVWKTEEDYQK